MRISDWSSDVCSSDLRKGDAIENLGALVDRFGAGPEQTAPFLRRFQVTLAIGAQQTPRILEIGALANAGDHIVERTLLARRVTRVIGCEQGNQIGRGRWRACVWWYV